MHVVVEPDPAAAARTVADLIAGHVRAAATIDLGLAGGSTPRAVYAALRERPLPWDRVWCWLPDERWVPPDHPASNTLMVRRELLDHVDAGFDAPDTTLADPHRAAAAYENVVLPHFIHGGAIAPEVVLLGVGPDGHTASLFPGSPAAAETRIGYVANWVAALDTWRLTATPALLSSARNVIFLVTGAAKAPIVRELIEEDSDLPARRVAAGAGETVWVLDEAAAARLD